MRLLSREGAAVALLPVPTLAQGDEILVDTELLSPDRLVQYLGRQLSPGTVRALVDAFLQGAVDPHPELTVPTVQDEGAGLALLAKGSTGQDVLLEVLVVGDLKSDVTDYDGVGFDVPRHSLIDAAHQLEEWNR